VTWPDWAAPAAGVWALAYGALGVYWALGGAGFPFGPENDPGAGRAAGSALGGLQADVGAPAIAALGLAGMVAAALLARPAARPRRGPLDRALLGFAWGLSALLLLLVPDARLLAAMAYAPVFLVGAPFGWPPVSFLVAVRWPVLNQGLCLAGGFLWGAAALAAQRRARAACPACGRTGAPEAAWTAPAAAARWGRWAVAVAVGVQVCYALVRYAWALGVPLGISEELLRQGRAEGMWQAGASLATVDVVGALLTLGLVQRWGEVVPRWVPGLGGRRVPPALAIAPASVVAAVVTAGGLGVVRRTLSAGFRVEDWATIGPGLLWPLWGAALGAATLAYYYRRRGSCRRCGRGAPPGLPSLPNPAGPLEPGAGSAASPPGRTARRRPPPGGRVAAGAGLLLAALAAALLPLGDPRLSPAPVPGQAYWDLPTGSRLAYVRIPAAPPAGTRPAPAPVVFLHGGPGTPDMAGDAAYFGQLAADGADVYVYDKVGTGRSSRLADPRGYTLARDVADLEAARERIGAPQLTLIGHSYGATVAAAYLAAHGGRVARVVFSSPGALPPVRAGGGDPTSRLTVRERLGVYALLLHPRALLAYGLLQADARAAHAFAGDAELDARFDAVYNRTETAMHCRGAPPGPELHGLGFYAHYYPQSAASPAPVDPRPALATRTAPALVVKGACDYMSWSSAVDYLRALPGARLVYLPGAGHNAYQDRPAEYLAAVRAFLAGTPPPEPPSPALAPGGPPPPGYEGPA
jgi:proline iminopeptidase